MSPSDPSLPVRFPASRHSPGYTPVHRLSLVSPWKLSILHHVPLSSLVLAVQTLTFKEDTEKPPRKLVDVINKSAKWKSNKSTYKKSVDFQYIKNKHVQKEIMGTLTFTIICMHACMHTCMYTHTYTHKYP